jgi:thiol-disulfide isomerase/thioredoxin
MPATTNPGMFSMLTHLLFATLSFVPATADAPFSDLKFDQALAAAKKDGKVVMIDFFTTWCVPCKKLDELTWPDAGVQKWLGEKTIALKMDAEKEVELAKKYAIVSYPTILFLKPDGQELGRITAYKTPAEFLSEANDTLAGKDSVVRAKERLAGHENDPMERERHAQALAETGKHEEALAEYLWCFDHGNENRSNGYAGVRLSFLLSEIVQLGRRFPPAIKALEERRDKAEASLFAGKGTFDDAAEFTALNRVLEAKGRTLTAFDRLKKEGHVDPMMNLVFLPEIAPALTEAKRYQDLLDAVGDADNAVKTKISLTEAALKIGEEHESAEEMAQFMREHVVEECSYSYEALLGTKQDDKASKIAERLTTFAPYASSYAILIQRALHADAVEAARSLADRGRKALPDKERKALERAASSIPAAK